MHSSSATTSRCQRLCQSSPIVVAGISIHGALGAGGNCGGLRRAGAAARPRALEPPKSEGKEKMAPLDRALPLARWVWVVCVCVVGCVCGGQGLEVGAGVQEEGVSHVRPPSR